MSITDRFRQIPALAQQPGIVDAAAILEDVVKQIRLANINQADIVADRFARMLVPEHHNRPLPAAAIVAAESETVFSISTEAELKASVGGNEYTFTPVYDTVLYPTSLKYFGFGQKCYDVSGEGLPQSFALGKPLPQGLFLLGLQMKETEVNQLEGLQLLFQHLDEETMQRLSWAKLHYKGRVYRLASASFPENGEGLVHTACDKEFLLLDRQRRDIADATAQQGLYRLVEVKDKYVMGNFVPDDYGIHLSEDSPSVGWAKLVLPEGMNLAKLGKVPVQLNAFPVFNAYSSIKDESLETADEENDKIVSIPVNTDEAFLALGRVWTHTDSPYLPEELLAQRVGGTYKLSVRNPAYLASLDIAGLINTLQSTLKSANPAALTSLSRNRRDDLQPYLQSLQAISEKWEEVNRGLQQITHDNYYLTIKPTVGAKVVYVEVWRTNATLANTLLPTMLDMGHAIPNCGAIHMHIPPDQIKYGKPIHEYSPRSYLPNIFPDLSNKRS